MNGLASQSISHAAISSKRRRRIPLSISLYVKGHLVGHSVWEREETHTGRESHMCMCTEFWMLPVVINMSQSMNEPRRRRGNDNDAIVSHSFFPSQEEHIWCIDRSISTCIYLYTYGLLSLCWLWSTHLLVGSFDGSTVYSSCCCWSYPVILCWMARCSLLLSLSSSLPSLLTALCVVCSLASSSSSHPYYCCCY